MQEEAPQLRRPGKALIVALTCLTAGAIASPAAATTYTVPAGPAAAVNGDGLCTLVEAAEAANTDVAVNECAAGSGDDAIALVGGFHALGAELVLGDPDPGDMLSVTPASAAPVTLQQDAGGNDRVLRVPNGSVSIDRVTITGGNFTGAGLGGGVAVVGNTTSLSLSNSTVTDNALGNIVNDGFGGGIGVSDNTSPSVTLTNVTVSDNQASHSGGGIFTGSASAFTMTNVTVTGNTSSTDVLSGGTGGGINRPTVMPKPLTIQNSIIAGNQDLSGTAPDCRGFGIGPTLPVLTSNLLGDATGCGYAPGAGDIVGAAPGLGPLAANGGPTFTHALLAGSPALDKALASCPATDQRGITRPQGTGCDIGAFELEVAPTTTPLPLPGANPKRRCKKKKKSKRSAVGAKKKKKKCKKRKKKRR